jgi:predicted TIM-barrel fold metal-dependent hydrolase
MLIDVHVHIYPPEVVSGWEKIAEREEYFGALVRGRAHKWCSAGDVLAAMAEDGVDESWVFGFGFKDLGLCKLCNDYALEAARESGGKLRALAVVPPLARGAAAELERCAGLGAIGAGEIFPDGQDFDISDMGQTWRFAATCSDLGLFACVHTAEPVGREYPGKGAAGPREAFALARNHPELKIIMAHWGGGLFMYEAIPEVRVALRNTRYDTAASPFVYGGDFWRVCGLPWVREKMMYGSDFPLLRYPRFKKNIGASLTPDVEELVFSRNAIDFSRGGQRVLTRRSTVSS